MSSLNDKNSEFAIHRVVVNNLEQDGAICDAYTKEYDEQKTFEGGTGTRLAFKNYNDKIKNYHSILKHLTGESRANISETIPVIDFAHIENTSFMSTYPYKNGSSTEIDPTISIAIDSDSNSASEETSALTYLEEEDKSIINRVLAGENMAEHFYNTRSDAVQEANLQVSPWIGDQSIIYKGIQTPSVLDLDTRVKYSSYRHDTIKVHRAEGSEWYIIDPLFSGEYDTEHDIPVLSEEVKDDKGNTMAALTSKSNGEYFLVATDDPEKPTSVTIPVTGTDKNGNKVVIRDPVTKEIKTKTIDVIIHSSFQLELNYNDIIVILPSNSYNSDPCRMLIFKANYSIYSDAFNDIQSNPYDFYVLELQSFDSSIELTEVAYGEAMPDYINDNNILPKINDYALCEKEYYANASGLLSGYFCEPYEWQEMGETRNVTKWKFSNDVDIAEEKGVTIDVGSKYFRGHLLGRGNPIDSPFRITEPEEAGYPGKATYIYDKVQNSAGTLLDNVTLPYDEWLIKAGAKVVALDAVVRKADYVGKNSEYGQYVDASTYKDLVGNSINKGYTEFPEKVKHEKKFIKLDGTIATYSDFQGYIDSCREHLHSDENEEVYVFYADLRTDEYACWRRRVQQAENGSGSKNHNSADYNSDDASGDISNQIYDIFEKIYYIDFQALMKKAGKDGSTGYQDALWKLDLKVASPIEAFAPDGGANTFLIYPEFDKYFPEELYLISRDELPLEEYSEDSKGLGMVSFYNKDEGKVICFKVAEVIAFKPSLIRKVEIWDPLLESDQKNDINYNYLEKHGTADDCYIYILRPMEINASNIEIIGPNGDPITFTPGVNNLQIMPMSYPSDYFPLRIDFSDNTNRYIVDESHRGVDTLSLKNSYIICGLPEYNTPSDFYKMYAGSAFNLGIFGDMLSDENGMGSLLEDTLKKILNSVITNWPLSNGTINPMIFEEFPDILNGLIELQPEMNKLIESHYEIPYEDESTGNLKVITASDLEGLNHRIDYDDSYAEYFFEVTVNKDSEDWQFTADEDFSTILSRRFGLIQPVLTSKDPTPRPSIRKLKGVIDNLTNDSVFTREECQILDKYLGNNTVAFVKLGDNSTENVTPSSIVNLATDIVNTAIDIIKETETQYQFSLQVEEEASFYGDYYTEESMYECFGVTYNEDTNTWDYDENSGVTSADYSKLVINYNGTILDNNGNAIDKKGRPSTYSEVDSYIINIRSNYKSAGSARSWLSADRYLNFKQFKDKYHLYSEDAPELTNSTLISRRNYIINKVSIWVSSLSATAAKEFAQGSETQPLSEEDIEAYADGVSEDGTPHLSVSEVDNGNGTYSLNIRFQIPNLEQVIEEVEVEDEDGSTTTEQTMPSDVYALVETDNYFESNLCTYTHSDVDVSARILQGVVDYVKTNLEGTGNDSYYVKYVQGDSDISGRENSLYYKRYQMLNNRMNKTQGPLAMAARFLNSKSQLTSISAFQLSLADSYKKFAKITPISSMRELSYFPTQEASGTTIAMKGKFYYAEELEELRKLINDKCVLTCNYCEVKDSCPFYNEEEVLKLYCDEAQSIDIYLKDNELDLIYYDDDPNNLSPNLIYTSSDGNDSELFDPTTLQNIHLDYSDILKKLSETGQVDATYNKRDLENLRTQLKSTIEDYDNETRGGLGFLLNGRYGTLQINDLATLANSSTISNSEIDVNSLPKYKVMYDALFFEDEDTEFLYAPSQHAYPVTLSVGPYGSKKTYVGTTRIKIPANIKLLAEANPGDDLYLVSDNTTDSTGKSIIPVIYINKARDVVYSFDLTETGVDEELTSASDTNLYAKDVAQWSINIAKGWCLEDPLGSHEDKYLDYDQYWMETIYKQIINEQGVSSYITLNGRSRATTGYQEPVIDADSYDETMAISGKPVVNSYINYTRKFMISMDCVQWVKPNSTIYPDLSYESKVETQKSVLPLMTTNLRLVLVKNRAVNITADDEETEE